MPPPPACSASTEDGGDRRAQRCSGFHFQSSVPVLRPWREPREAGLVAAMFSGVLVSVIQPFPQIRRQPSPVQVGGQHRQSSPQVLPARGEGTGCWLRNSSSCWWDVSLGGDTQGEVTEWRRWQLQGSGQASLRGFPPSQHLRRDSIF